MATTDATLTREAYEAVCKTVRGLDAIYYEDPDNVVVPDREYDELFDSLLAYEAAHGAASDSPTQRVGGSASKDDIEHSVPMLSLSKVTTEEYVHAFVQHVGDALVTVEPKFDGVSLSLRYEDGKLVEALTRGDGTRGQDVTPNARLIAGIPHDLHDYTGLVRGEVVIARADLVTINERREADGEKVFANTRNAAAGALTGGDPREARKRRLRFYPFDVLPASGDEADGDDIWERFSLHGLWGPEEVNDLMFVPVEGNRFVWERVLSLMALRPELPFDTDGVVIKVSDHASRAKLGSKDRHPNWAVAYKDKSTQETAEAKLLDVTWQVGTGGAVTPVAEVEPTECGGTVIRRITLHNAKFIADHDIHMGDSLIITRAGDVIPQVTGRIEGPKHGLSTPAERVLDKRPEKCPSCGVRLTGYGNSDQIRCTGLNCPEQIVGKLVHWASRNAMDIDAIGPKWMRVFYEKLGVADVSELYTLDVAELLSLDGIKAVSAERFMESIEASKKRGMARVLFGLAIPEVGEGTAKRLARSFADIDKIAGSDVATLMGIKDIGEVAAQSIVGWFGTHSNYQIVKALHHHGVVMEAPMAAQSTSEARTFVLTGSIEGYKNRKAFAEVLEGFGWTMQSGVSKTTDMLITDDAKVSTKMKKAADLGVTLMNSEAALALARG